MEEEEGGEIETVRGTGPKRGHALGIAGDRGTDPETVPETVPGTVPGTVRETGAGTGAEEETAETEAGIGIGIGIAATEVGRLTAGGGTVIATAGAPARGTEEATATTGGDGKVVAADGGILCKRSLHGRAALCVHPGGVEMM